MPGTIRACRITLPILATALAVGFVPAGAQGAAGGTIAPVKSCAELAKTDLTAIGGKGSTIASATEASDNGAAVCTVEGVLAPSIGFRVRLPMQGWSGRYLQIGCGGLCGMIPRGASAADGCVPLNVGNFVIAADDMGHAGHGGEFARDVRMRADFAHRANHVTALAAKALIEAYYGRGAMFSYFSGCSDGGREALIEAQRYPDDFDGIIAGAPAMNFEVQNSLYHGWQARSNLGPDGKPILLAAKLPLLHNAVLAACDGLDGLKDGLIEDPRACRFDPAVLLCKSARDTSCLTAAEVAAVRKLYDGPRDPKTGTRLTIGGPQYGSELAWAGLFAPADAARMPGSCGMALDALRNIIFATNPPDGYDLGDLTFDLATFAALRAHHPLLDATNPDLSTFAAAGGKLILWHGWSDQHISPINTIAYHLAVESVMGKARAEGFERLYLFPGMYHCDGGEGPARIDLLTPMLDWVENGTAPDAVVVRSERMARPVYPYPAVAAYDGKGDPDLASSFKRGTPLTDGKVPDWAGADFYAPYRPTER